MKKLRISIPVIMAFLLLGLTACGKYGGIREGECAGVICFTNIPKEFSLLEENLRDQITITVKLENDTTGKTYTVRLKKENDYRQELSLHPGTYRVAAVESSQSENSGIVFAADAEQMVFHPEREAIMTVSVSNGEEFTRHWMAVQPMPEIQLADKYSGMIQINRKVMHFTEILPELVVTGNPMVEGHQRYRVEDILKGIAVDVRNDTDQALPWSECRVVGMTVSQNTVVFPEGVTIGKSPASVCDRESGVYGEPTGISGFWFAGIGLDTLDAVYQDSVSGSRITVTISADGKSVEQISYELDTLEE